MSDRLPAPPPEVPRERGLDGLAPAFRRKLLMLVLDLQRQGYDPVIFETLRTNERQRYLHGFGRKYDDGRGIVTHSEDADETWHGFGLAADIISKAHAWAAPEEFWIALEQTAENFKLRSGRDWDGDDATRERFVDAPHVQWARCRRSPSPRAARLRAEGGVEAVWHEVGAL